MSTAARSTGAPDRRPSRYSGPVRVGTHRTGVVRTGVVRTGAGRGTARGGPAGHRPSQPLRSAPVRPDLRLVAGATPARGSRSRTTSRRAPFVLLVLALLVGTTLSLLVLNTAIAVDSLKATALRQQNDHRTQEEQWLRRQVIEGSTPQQLATDASKAGLVPPGTPGYLVVQPHGSVLRGVPSPAPAPAAPSPAAPSPAAVSHAPTPSPGQPQGQPPAQLQAQGQPRTTTGGN